jgi:hypothetical protein
MSMKVRQKWRARYGRRTLIRHISRNSAVRLRFSNMAGGTSARPGGRST